MGKTYLIDHFCGQILKCSCVSISKIRCKSLVQTKRKTQGSLIGCRRICGCCGGSGCCSCSGSSGCCCSSSCCIGSSHGLTCINSRCCNGCCKYWRPGYTRRITFYLLVKIDWLLPYWDIVFTKLFFLRFLSYRISLITCWWNGGKQMYCSCIECWGSNADWWGC